MGSPQTQTLLERHLSRPLAAAVARIRDKVRSLNDQLGMPAAADQYDGRAIPFAFSRMYGPLPLTTPRRYDNGSNNGFEKLATVATPAVPYLPRYTGNIRTNRRGVFRWEAAAINSYMSWTWDADVDISGFNFRAFTVEGDIFDNAFPNNGGAMLMNNNRYVDLLQTGSGEVRDVPNASFDLGLYEKKRNRYLHDGTRLPSALFSGQEFINRLVAEPMPLDSNTEIEPQLYVNEVRIRDELNTDTLFNAANFRLWVSLVLLGTIEQE